MMTRITSAMTQLMRDLSGVAEWPAFCSAAASTFWYGPSTLAASATPPIWVTTPEPGAPLADLKDKPCLVRKSLVRSQSENVLHGPTKMWKWQVDGSAVTVIGVFAWNSSSPGLM